MDIAILQQQIQKVAQAARDAGQTIEIDYSLPYVAVNTGVQEYFFQEHEADKLLEDYKLLADMFDVTVEDSILHSAQNW